VKKIAAIFFFLVYLLATTELHQLLKLPVIFQHYSEHQQEDNNITILKFLALHYLHGSPKDKDYAKDMQLPFKTSDDCISYTAVAFVPLIAQQTLPVPTEIKPAKTFNLKDRFILSSYLSKIWQPPRYC
jgi:hypothetical protein